MTAASNRIEMVVQKRITKNYLDASPLSISLNRPVFAETAAGGKVLTVPTVIPPQEFRLVPFKRRLTQVNAVTQEGFLTASTYALVGKAGSDVRPKDYFTLNFNRYEVETVDPSSPEFQFRTLAVLSFYGTPDS